MLPPGFRPKRLAFVRGTADTAIGTFIIYDDRGPVYGWEHLEFGSASEGAFTT